MCARSRNLDEDIAEGNLVLELEVIGRVAVGLAHLLDKDALQRRNAWCGARPVSEPSEKLRFCKPGGFGSQGQEQATRHAEEYLTMPKNAPWPLPRPPRK